MTMEVVKTPENTQASAMDVIAMLLKENNDLRRGMLELQVNGGGNGTTKKGRAPKSAVRCMDTKTGNVYHSHASAGMAVAPEFGLKVHNFVWYEVLAKDNTRFTDISEEKYQAVLKANAEKQEAKVTTPAPVAAPVNPPASTNQNQPHNQNHGKGK